jgi:putative ATP-binding cassette transporter
MSDVMYIDRPVSHHIIILHSIVRQFTELSTFSAGIDRLSSFYRAIREADAGRGDKAPLLLNPNLKKGWDEDGLRLSIKDLITDDDGSSSTITLHKTSSNTFSLINLTLVTPDSSRTLIRNLTVPNQEGDLLITGPSGVGKSSLLRAIAGLWTRGDGMVERPSKAYFLPQTPYCTVGSLRDQLLYPKDSTDAAVPSDGDLVQILSRVELQHLTPELSVELDWSHRLSLGEQQRLAFGRVLVHQPLFVLVDEATSALDLGSEQQMYGLLLQQNVRYVSVGHRPSLWQYHDRRLHLNGGTSGGYEISTMEAASAGGSGASLS